MIGPVRKSDLDPSGRLARAHVGPHVGPTDVGLEVDDGVVTLTGTVSSWAKRHAAQEAAHRVAGVLDVAVSSRSFVAGRFRAGIRSARRKWRAGLTAGRVNVSVEA
jgi:BON domain